MRLSVRRQDGQVEPVHVHAVGVTLAPGDHFEMLCATGGGYGDPLDREPAAVLADVEAGRLDQASAREVYGVVFAPDGGLDAVATASRRTSLRHERLARAAPAKTPVGAVVEPGAPRAAAQPLYPGVVQLGDLAISEETGAALALAPGRWLDGCPTLEAPAGPGANGVITRAHLDPLSGRMLYVDVVRPGDPPSIAVEPERWTQAARR
jgi:N-methylhydantoinase B